MEQDGIHPHVHGGVPQEVGVPEPQTFVYLRDKLVEDRSPLYRLLRLHGPVGYDGLVHLRQRLLRPVQERYHQELLPEEAEQQEVNPPGGIRVFDKPQIL